VLRLLRTALRELADDAFRYRTQNPHVLHRLAGLRLDGDQVAGLQGMALFQPYCDLAVRRIGVLDRLGLPYLESEVLIEGFPWQYRQHNEGDDEKLEHGLEVL